MVSRIAVILEHRSGAQKIAASRPPERLLLTGWVEAAYMRADAGPMRFGLNFVFIPLLE